MRSTFAGLNTMVGGINTNRLSLDTVGHNISNASTTGYSRQSVNQAATNAQEVYSIYGTQLVGTGVDSLSITRARNIYADKQYWKENGDNSYYTAQQTNYSKLEAIFNDSDDTGVENAMTKFYKAWSEVSTSASTSTTRQTVIDAGSTFADRLSTASKQVQQQITSNYDDIKLNVTKVNTITDQIVALNKNIASLESTGANANDLRDQRDNLVDTLSGYVNTNVYQEANGMYTIVSNGASLVSGISKLNLKVSDATPNSQYGINDYSIQIQETGTTFTAGSGTLQSEVDAIKTDKEYIDKLANMAGFMMTTLNDQHKAGYGMNGSTIDKTKTRINFYGDNDTTYTWDDTNQAVVAKPNSELGTSSTLKGVEIINAMTVNSKLTGSDGANYLAVTGNTVKNVTTNTEEVTAAGNDSYVLSPTVDTATNTRTATMIKYATDSAGKITKTTTTTTYEPNNTGDGSNAVLLSALFNSTKANTVNTAGTRSIGDISLNSYYNASVTNLGSLSEAMNSKVSAQGDIMTQVESWRSSTSGVNWNEELTNMIKFQQGFSACSRCLTTMDEMLDKLVNSTGTVGR